MDNVEILFQALACGISDWNEFRGDPWLQGALFMAAYGLAALAMFRVARGARRDRTLWIICGVLFLFQLANVHLDLHGMIFTVGRCLSHAQGWYEQRHVVQFAVLWTLGGLAILTALVVYVYMSAGIARNLTMVSGVAVALGINLLKGINYHSLERIYGGTYYGGLRGADLVELAGIGLALAGTFVRMARMRRRARRRKLHRS